MNRQKSACLGLVLSISVLLGTAQGQTAIPLGTYSAVFPERFMRGGRNFDPGEYFVTFLPNGQLQYGLDDITVTAGTYTVTQDRVEINSPFERGACATGATYRFQLTGNRLSLTPVDGTTDGCVQRATWFTNAPFFREGAGAGAWRDLGPEGGRIYALLAQDGKLFAAGDGGGIFVSTDNGQNWRATSNIRGFIIRSLGAFQGTLFAGGNFGGIAVSTDGGQTWVNRATGPAQNVTTFDFVEHNGRFYAATVSDGLWRMAENPYQWEKVAATGLSNQSIYTLASVGNRLFAGTDGGGIFVSTDGGSNWTAASNGLTILRIRTLAVDSNRIYAGSAFGTSTTNEVFVSENNGQNWTRLGNGIAADFPAGFTNAVYELVPLGGRLFAVSTSGVLMHDGTSWSTVHRGAPVISFFAAIAVGDQLFAGSWYEGVARSTDGGATWSRVNSGLNKRYANAVYRSGNVLYAGMNDGVFISTNDGQTWERSNPAIVGTFDFLAFDGKVYAGTTNGVYVTTDAAQTWARVSNGLGVGTVFRLLAVGNTLYAAVYNTNTGGVYRSTDGLNWTAASNGLLSRLTRDLVLSGSDLFVCTDNQGLFRSSDQAQNWTRVTGLPAGTVYALGVSGGNLLASVLEETVYRSSDNGQTWTRPEGFSPAFAYPIYVSGGSVYTTGNSGPLRSTDNGRSWQSISAGFEARYANSFFASGATLFVASYNGIHANNALVNRNATVSAASFSPNIADKAIVAAFGTALAASTTTANSVPLPTTLAGTTVRVRDSLGVERLAPLFFVSGGQVNYQIPPGTAAGAATVTITNSDGIGATGEINVRAAAPAVFTTNASGTGAASAVDALTGAAGPFNATRAGGEPNIIAVFGTGLGGDATDADGNVNAEVTARIDGNATTLLYAGRAPGFVGTNQFNVQLPAGITSGTHTLTLTRGGVTSNSVTIAIR